MHPLHLHILHNTLHGSGGLADRNKSLFMIFIVAFLYLYMSIFFKVFNIFLPSYSLCMSVPYVFILVLS